MAEENEIQKTDPIPEKLTEKKDQTFIPETPAERLLDKQIKFLGRVIAVVSIGATVVLAAAGIFSVVSLSSAKDEVTQAKVEISQQTRKIDSLLANADQKIETLQNTNYDRMSDLLEKQMTLQNNLISSQEQIKTNLENRFDKLAGKAFEPALIKFKYNGLEFTSKDILIEYSLLDERIEWLSLDEIRFQIHNLGGVAANNLKVYLSCQDGLFNGNNMGGGSGWLLRQGLSINNPPIVDFLYPLHDMDKNLSPKEFLGLSIPINVRLNLNLFNQPQIIKIKVHSGIGDPQEAELRLTFIEKK